MDVITPYGYGGPVGEGLAGFYEAYREWCAERGVVSTFVRYHPLFENYREAGTDFHAGVLERDRRVAARRRPARRACTASTETPCGRR